MTKFEQIVALVATATTAATQVARQAALEEALMMKKAAKVSFSKIGVSDFEIQNATIAAQTPDSTESVEEVVETTQLIVEAQEEVQAPRTLRDKAMALLATVEGGYAVRIKLLMDTFGISKANANYYVSRVAKGKK